ncbi:LGFP repeat-containing protein [Mycobacterium sp. C31M]
MTRQRTRLGNLAGRAAALLVGAGLMAATVLVAPPAGAEPEADADAAITAAWETVGGGPAGPLGPKDGGVYPAGDGFGQNFAGGKIFFTPETGAHIVTGAILEKYESLGGPADSDLGFPTIDEGPGRAANSRNVTFNAPDSPVIFWTPDTGARVVRGAINSAWDAVGGSAGVLGVPSDDETTNGDVVAQKFTGGEISWDRKTRTFTTTPPELAGQLGAVEVPSDATSAIAAARRAAGGALGPLGAEEGAQYAIGADGVGQNYTGGKIFYSPATGANVVTGQVLAKYESVGGPTGDLGFPTASEGDGGLAPQSAVVPFAAEDKPVIFWTPDFGAVIVRGAMNAAWDKLGGATGELGAPKTDQTDNGGVITQQFSGGSISWDKAANRFSTEPAGLQSQLAGLEVPGADAPQAPAESPEAAPAADGDKWYTWRWWWLLGLIPLLGLIAVIAVAVLRNRRPREDDHLDEPYDRGYGGYEDRYESREDEFHTGPANDYVQPSQWASVPADSETPPYAKRTAEAGLAPAEDVVDEPDDFDRDVDDADEHEYEYGADDRFGDELETPDIAAEPPADLPLFDDDAIDTAPTRIESLPFESALEEPVLAEPEPEPRLEQPTAVMDVPSGRHAAASSDDEADDAGWTSMRLATTDRYRAPEGYPVKADTKTGLYWAPGSRGYRDTEAEIWFASEEFAQANGFIRAD